MSKTSANFSDEEKVLLARLTRPLPMRVRREMDVCVDMEQFETALEELQAAMTEATSKPATMSRFASASAVHISWKDSLAELEISFEKTDRLARALVYSTKIMLGLD